MLKNRATGTISKQREWYSPTTSCHRNYERMPLGDWGFKTRLMDWKLLRALEIGLAVLKADNPPQGMNGIRDTPVVDMIEDIADLIILIIGEIAIEIMVMVPTSIDLANTPRRHLYIQGSPKMYMRIRSFQQQI